MHCAVHALYRAEYREVLGVVVPSTEAFHRKHRQRQRRTTGNGHLLNHRCLLIPAGIGVAQQFGEVFDLLQQHGGRGLVRLSPSGWDDRQQREVCPKGKQAENGMIRHRRPADVGRTVTARGANLPGSLICSAVYLRGILNKSVPSILNRDRETPHGASPPTPPCIRVTYTAVR